MHENRETSVVPEAKTGRSGKAVSQTPDMHAAEESDSSVVPMNQPNNSGKPWAEAGKGRLEIKENITQPNTRPTQSGVSVSQGLSGVRERAKERRQEKFTALLHHLTIGLLRESYFALQRRAAPGVDGDCIPRKRGSVSEQRIHSGQSLRKSASSHPSTPMLRDVLL